MQVSPHLAGNSNLNIECLLRGIEHEFSANGMLPVWHVQVAIRAPPARVPYARPCGGELLRVA